MLYQTLVAAWPLDLAPDDADGLKQFEERVAAWQEKALREAKRRTGWAAPNADYEGACRAFLAACLDPARPIAGETRRLRRPHRPARRDQQPDPDPAPPHQPRRPRPVSRHRVLGFLPGRPRQPPARRFRRNGNKRSKPAEAPAATAATLARRPGQTGDNPPRPGFPRRSARAVHRRRLHAAPRRRPASGTYFGLPARA